MTKLTDVLRRLAEANLEDVGQGVAGATAATVAQCVVEPACEPIAPVPAVQTAAAAPPVFIASAAVETRLPTFTAPAVAETQPPPRAAPPVVTRPARPDVLHLCDFVAGHTPREPGQGSVVLVLSPADAPDDARQTVSLLVGELAGALATRPGGETLVVEVPPTTRPGPPAGETDLAMDAATIADVIRSRPQLLDLVRPDESTGAWRAASHRLPLRSPPAPWPALAALVGECRQHFAWTLIDGGSWDQVESAELARRSDSVYLVLHEGHTGRAAARRWLGELRRAGANVAGCLFVGRWPDRLSVA